MKFRRTQRGTIAGLSNRGSNVDFGEFGLKAMDRGYITSRQIEAARKAITHFTKRSGKLWIRVFPDNPVTKKPAETRMGGGKGLADHFSCRTRPGKIMFELSGVTEAVAREAFDRASHKLPIKTGFVQAD